MTTMTRGLALALLCGGLATAGVATAADGRALYKEHCAKCHGEDGEAETWRGILTFAQDFTVPSYQANNTDEQILRKIDRGPRAMPSFKNKLTLEERQALVKVVRDFGKP